MPTSRSRGSFVPAMLRSVEMDTARGRSSLRLVTRTDCPSIEEVELCTRARQSGSGSERSPGAEKWRSREVLNPSRATSGPCAKLDRFVELRTAPSYLYLFTSSRSPGWGARAFSLSLSLSLPLSLALFRSLSPSLSLSLSPLLSLTLSRSLSLSPLSLSLRRVRISHTSAQAKVPFPHCKLEQRQFCFNTLSIANRLSRLFSMKPR